MSYMNVDKIKEFMWDAKFTIISLIAIIFMLIFLDPNFIKFTNNQFVMTLPHALLMVFLIVIFIMASRYESKKLRKYL